MQQELPELRKFRTKKGALAIISLIHTFALTVSNEKKKGKQIFILCFFDLQNKDYFFPSQDGKPWSNAKVPTVSATFF